MIAAALQLMLLGMGIVFFFLVILVLLMGAMAYFVRLIESRQTPETPSHSQAELVAALTAASIHHRHTRGAS